MAGWVNGVSGSEDLRISILTHKRLEQQAQIAVIEWAKLHEAKWPALKYLIAIPNGAGRLSVRAAVALKKAGVKAGPSDLFLPVPVQVPNEWSGFAETGHGPKSFSGLWLELKVIHRRPHPTKKGLFQIRKGVVSQEQREWLEGMREQGYASAVAWCPEEAQHLLTLYLNGEWKQEPLRY